MKKMDTSKRNAKITITLSWPDKALWINRRAGHHYRKETPAKEAALNEGCWSALHGMNGTKPDWTDTRLALDITAHKPNKAHYDLDNLAGALKHQLDGICATLGINDNQFDRLTVTRGEPVKGGRVTVEISALTKEQAEEIYASSKKALAEQEEYR